jgi:uncharacterized protein YbbK (DUF523 family)
MGEKVLVSACLLGFKCRYDGKHKRCEKLLNTLKEKNLEAVPVCPEVEGGLPVPREPATREGARVITNFTRRDLTDFFKLGALKTLQRAKREGIRKAFLKSKSPSCGEEGLAAELLKKNGVEVEWF